MDNLNPTDLNLIKSFTTRKYDSIPRLVYISFIKKDVDLLNVCKSNNLSFNYICDEDNYIEVVPPTQHANGSYKMFGESVENNSKTNHISIGVVVGDSKDEFVKTMGNFVELIRYIDELVDHDHISFRPVKSKDKYQSLFKTVRDEFIVDLIFDFYTYFKQ